jgi:hypothetical protein
MSIKSLLSFALTCAAAAFVLTTATSGQAQECGDVNENGEVTAADALAVLQTAVGIGALSCRTGDFVALEDRVATIEAGLAAKKVVFITSTTYQGIFGGLSSADSICDERALAGGLTGTFKAWLSDSVSSPDTRFTKSSVPYKLTNGASIAQNWADLTDGSLSHRIQVDEFGNAPDPLMFGPSFFVWTNTLPDGTPDLGFSCNNWVGPAELYLGGYGNIGFTQSNWTDNGPGSCAAFHSLVCFEQ